MDIKERNSYALDSRHAWLLLFLFLCGSLLTLVYAPELELPSGLERNDLLLCAALLLLFSSFLTTSVCGWLFLPLASVAFGVLTAFGANETMAAYAEREREAISYLLVMGGIVPAHFVLGVWGMTNSRRLWRALIREGSIDKKGLIGMYSMMTIAAAVSFSLAAYVILYR